MLLELSGGSLLVFKTDKTSFVVVPGHEYNKICSNVVDKAMRRSFFSFKSCTGIGCPSRKNGAILPAQDYTCCYPQEKKIAKSHMINPSMMKLWLDIGVSSFCAIYGP